MLPKAVGSVHSAAPAEEANARRAKLPEDYQMEDLQNRLMIIKPRNKDLICYIRGLEFSLSAVSKPSFFTSKYSSFSCFLLTYLVG